ncbi:MAG: hypothetical protein M1819_002629 [Sarea resinae]|nr:MAG: hypothetical protein M1819_002629 [Sarea resinae]
MSTPGVPPEGKKPFMEGVTAVRKAVKILMDRLAETPEMPKHPTFPPAPFACAKRGEDGRQTPQAIAHRGYKAKFPENTLLAFAGAVEEGAHAIEMDLHISRDGVVVLSHDIDLKRCFGRDEKISDCDWEFLSTVRTVAEPHEPMPRLKDVLNYLQKPGLEDIWLILDIKLHDDPRDMVRLIAQTIEECTPSDKTWKDRIVLGCWAAQYVALCNEYLPGFPIAYIGVSIKYANRLLPIPNVSFSILQHALMTPSGRKFTRKVQAMQRPILSWTVNSDYAMKWCIRQKLDGVITDNPKRFLEICDHYDESSDKQRLTLKGLIGILRIMIFATLFSIVFEWRHGKQLDKRWSSRAVEKKD